MCSCGYIGKCSLSLQLCSGLRQSLHLSVHSVYPHCFLCLQPSQRCWELLIPGRIFSLPGLLCTHQAGHPGWRGDCWVPLLVCRPSCTQTHAHSTVQPLGQICQLFPACEHKHTQHILFLSRSLSVLSLPPVHCTQAQSMLGELMVQVERVCGWLGRGGGEEVCIG